MSKIAVTCDCSCDLTEELLQEYGIERVFSYIRTEEGRFCDFREITALNVFDYLENGGTAIAESPAVSDLAELFRRKLAKFDEVIHVSLSAGISKSCKNAMLAAKQIGAVTRVHVVDSGQLSTGTGHVAIRASQMVRGGHSAADVIRELELFKRKVSTSFILKDLKCLHQNGKVSEKMFRFFKNLNLHPVLHMKNGKFALKTFYYGNYEKAQIQYIRDEMRHYEKIDTQLAFVTHAGASVKEVEAAVNEVRKRITFDNLFVTEASATISSNSGPHTIGLLYIEK